jgi:hypothetical protein
MPYCGEPEKDPANYLATSVRSLSAVAFEFSAIQGSPSFARNTSAAPSFQYVGGRRLEPQKPCVHDTFGGEGGGFMSAKIPLRVVLLA